MRRRLVPVAVGAIAAVATAAVLASGGSAQAPGPRTLTFTELNKGSTFNVVDNPPLSPKRRGFPLKASAGDQIMLTTRFADQSGKAAGVIAAACTAVNRNKRFERAPFACHGVSTLTDGTITLEATLDFSANKVTAAITGGTGAYNGARGTFTSITKGRKTVDTYQLLGG